MTESDSFGDALNTELRWPTMGDMPFVVGNDPFDNTNIAHNPLHRFALMKDGYKEAADLMVEKSEARPSARDTLVFPIIFNYRHFLELSLKWQLSAFGPTVGTRPNWQNHDLATLWHEFLEMLKLYGIEDPDGTDTGAGQIILEFSKIDPGSYSYRYPVDRGGRPVPIAHSELHLPTLAKVMEKVAGYFDGCDGYLGSLLDAGP